MAKKIMGSLKLMVKAQQANPSPPVGPALGQRGLNIMMFTKEFNARSADIPAGTHRRARPGLAWFSLDPKGASVYFTGQYSNRRALIRDARCFLFRKSRALLVDTEVDAKTWHSAGIR